GHRGRSARVVGVPTPEQPGVRRRVARPRPPGEPASLSQSQARPQEKAAPAFERQAGPPRLNGPPAVFTTTRGRGTLKAVGACTTGNRVRLTVVRRSFPVLQAAEAFVRSVSRS